MNTPDDDTLTNELLADLDPDDTDEFLASLLGDSMPTHPQLTAEQVEAQVAMAEAAKSYDVGVAALRLHGDIALVKASLNKLLIDTTAHLNAEFNKTVVSDDVEGRDFLMAAEAPRWYQLAVQDLQTGFMKLERAINHPEGL